MSIPIHGTCTRMEKFNIIVSFTKGSAIWQCTDSNHQFFRSCDREIWWMTSKNNRALLLYYVKLCANPLVNSYWIYSPETLNSGRNWWYVTPYDLEIWWMTLESNRAPLQCYFKLCAAFRSHWWIQTGVTVRKRPIWVKFDDF